MKKNLTFLFTAFFILFSNQVLAKNTDSKSEHRTKHHNKKHKKSEAVKVKETIKTKEVEIEKSRLLPFDSMVIPQTDIAPQASDVTTTNKVEDPIVHEKSVPEKTIHHHKEHSSNAKNFEGVALAAGLGLNAYNTRLKYDGLDISGNDSHARYDLGKVNLSGILNISYLKAVSNNWLFGLGAKYYITPNNAGRESNVRSDNYSFTNKVDNHFSIYFQPTYAINNTTSLFAQISYHSARIKMQDPNGQVFPSLNYTGHLNGIGYGLGLMTFLSQNVFLKPEIEFIDFGQRHISYPASGNMSNHLTVASAIINLGYRF